MTSSRKIISLDIGQYVCCDDIHYKILEHMDLNSIIGTNLETGRAEVLSIKKLRAIKDEPTVHIDIESIADKDWKRAHKRWDAIKPLIRSAATRADVDKRAEEIGVNFTTLYRWMGKYNTAGSFEGLLARKTGVAKGSKRLSDEVEKILKKAIDDIYMTKQREPVKNVVDEVKRQCKKQGIPDRPHANTIRSRINSIAPSERMKKRGMRRQANQKYGAVPGHFPNVEAPLDCVQIDHTPVDVILVDDEYRLPIGRPQLSIAIDIYSRLCTGYYLSLDAPSILSDAMCVAHSVLKKDKWLTMHDVNDEWPAFGLMKMVHTDNGSDFKSETFSHACMMHGIEFHNRPIKGPQYGGHIERLIRTKMKEVHSLPGTTFSSIKDKDEYESEKLACMTFEEFEKWLVGIICIYNKTIHSELLMTPERKWEIGIFGDGKNPGFGLPSTPDDPESFLLDFMPMKKRTVQRTGVKIDGLCYYDDVLRDWIGAEDKENKGKARKFIFRRDPRDISEITFYDPELKQYFVIPLANPSFSGMSLWEYKEARAQLKADGLANFDEDKVLDKLEELRENVKKSAAKTKSARIKRQKQKNREKMTSPVSPGKVAENKTKSDKKTHEKVSDDSLSDLMMDELVDDESLSGFGDVA